MISSSRLYNIWEETTSRQPARSLAKSRDVSRGYRQDLNPRFKSRDVEWTRWRKRKKPAKEPKEGQPGRWGHHSVRMWSLREESTSAWRAWSLG